MSGKRSKRLRAEFFTAFGRFPKKTRMTGTAMKIDAKTLGVPLGRATATIEEEVRVNGIFRMVKRTQQILRAIYEVKVTAPSEWRRWKKSAGDRQAFEEMVQPTVLHAKPGVVLIHKMPERLAA